METMIMEGVHFTVTDIVNILTTTCTLSGFSLKDLKSLNVKHGYEKMRNYFQRHLSKEIITEDKKEIILDSLLVIEDYLKDSREFDNKTFDKILKLTVNGIKVEDELTKEYLKILRRLTFLDLKTFEVLFKEPILKEWEEQGYVVSMKSIYNVIYCEKEKIDVKNELKGVPIQLLENSLKNLIENKLIHSERKGDYIDNPLKENEKLIKLIYLTDLGENIMKLLE